MLSLMASHGCPSFSRLVFHPEQSITQMIKDFPPYIPFKETRQDTLYRGISNLRPNEYQEPWKPMSIVHRDNQPQTLDSTVGKPLVIDMKDACSNPELLSFGIAEKCERHEEIMRLFTSRASELETGGLDLSSLSNLSELQPFLFNVHQQEIASSLIFPTIRFTVDDEKPLLDLLGDMVGHSKFSFDLDNRVLVSASGTDMKDILSIVAEYYSSKNSSKSCKQHMLVPYFDRPKSRKTQAALRLSSLKMDAAVVAPTKSPEKTKTKASTKKKNSRNAGTERDIYKRNFFHSCESLLSVMMNKRHDGKMAILSIQKSGAELPQLLNRFSAGIAGTGLAVLLSIVCKVACGRVPFCSSKLFTTGLGFGLVWLSWAVKKLRDTVVYIIKSSGKLNSEEEMISRVDESVNQIYFRAATLMAFATLKLV